MNGVELQIIKLLKRSKQPLTINEVAEKLKIERHTAAKYLEALHTAGLCQYEAVGKSKQWRTTPSALLSLISQDNPLADELKELLQKVDNNITFQSKNNDIIWSNKEDQTSKKCYEVFADQDHPCEHCNIKHATQETHAICSDKDMISKPILNKENELIATINVRK